MSVQELRNMPHEAIAKAAHEVSPVAKVMRQVIPEPVRDRTPEFSVITCSVNDQKFHGVSECYKVALAGEDYEIVRISDAQGLAEGYARGAQQARGRTLIFTHDDAAPLRPIGARLRSHLRRVDIVAGAGTDRLDGPAWFTAGPPHVFGQVLNKIPGKQEMMLTVYGVPAVLVPGIVAFDGFWFACKREVLDVVNFDPDTCPGFHMYDVDFSFRAALQGLRVGVACDLSLCHASTGGYGDPKWKPLADRWMAKHGAGLSQHKPRQFQFMGVTGADPNDMIGIMEEFVERTR
jgi:hypothetical protein